MYVLSGILQKGANSTLTNHGKALAKLPDFGSLAMSKCVLAALNNFRCGADLIALSAILNVLNTTAVFKSIPSQYKSVDGDFMTLLNVMNAMLVVKQSVPARDFNLVRFCNTKGLNGIQHILQKALRRHSTLETAFNLSEEYRIKANIKSNSWESIARSLLSGYYDNVFVLGKDLFQRTKLYFHYNGSTVDNVAELDSQCVLAKSANRVLPSFILARDIRYSSSLRSKAILSFVGKLESGWAEHSIERKLVLTTEEETRLNTNNRYADAAAKYSTRIKMSLTNANVLLSGSIGTVFDTELYLLQEMGEDYTFVLENKNPPTGSAHANLDRNLKGVMKMPHIFNPMKWRWEHEKQVTISVNCNTSTNVCEITVKGRNSECKNVKREFDSFLSWLQNCAVIRHPNISTHIERFFLVNIRIVLKTIRNDIFLIFRCRSTCTSSSSSFKISRY
jgi:hypothetical protein